MFKNDISKQIEEFYKNFNRYGEQLSIEDMNVALESLDMALKNLNSEKREAIKRRDEQIAREKAEEEKRKAEEKKRKEEEHIQSVTSMDLPMDWSNVFDLDERTNGVHADSIPDGLIMSLNNLGRVDIEYISSITGETYKDVILTLKGSIYQNPLTWNECFYKGWETADDYLSGNLKRKWNDAKEADKKYNGYFSDNVKAIEKVLPPSVATKDIYITLGSPWVPADIIDDFIRCLYGGDCKYYYDESLLKVKHDEITGAWEIPYKSRYCHSIEDTKTYGTNRFEALYILEKTLNMKTITVTDEVKSIDNSSGKKRVINKEETILAIEKQEKLIKEFQNWVWLDENRKQRLETIFENQYSCVRRRTFDGSFLTFPQMSKDVELYPYQKNAVARILFTPNTLLAHDVGSGKTYIMIAAGMELKRMGLSKKNLFVVPNNIVSQWKDIFLSMYPDADILVVEPKNFTPSKREKMLEKIRDEEYDGILMAYSCFEEIPISKHYYLDELEEKKKK